jgi:hypothetical protein
MPRVLLTFCVMFWLTIGAATAVAAQAVDSRVPRAGTIRVDVGGGFQRYDTRFGSPGAGGGSASEALQTPFAATITSAELVPLQQLEALLNSAFEALEGESAQVGPSTLFLASANLRAGADHRRVPFTVELGILPRVSLRARVPLVQHWLRPMGLTVDGGTVGLNPDRVFNQTLLGEIDAAFVALGASGLLPTAGSPLGIALQERVRGATGQELRLPAEPIGRIGLTGLETGDVIGTGVYDPARPAWELGDTELAVRIQLLNSTASLGLGTRAGAGYRSALELGMRLPGGSAATADYLVLPPPDQGLSGLVVGLGNEVFASPRIGAHVGVRWEALQAVEIGRRSWIADEAFPPLPQDEFARWKPGNRLTLEVAPQFRLVDEIELSTSYLLQRRSSESLATAAGVELAEPFNRTAQRWGLGLRYSTLGAYEAGRATIPLEARLAWSRTVAGSNGAPAARWIEMNLSIFGRLWGRP